MRLCARRIVSAASVVKATSLDDGLVGHAPWRRVAPAALLIRIKPRRESPVCDGALPRSLPQALCITRMWLPDGSRNPASTPYGCCIGSCVNSTPLSRSSS
jgi:hypothetical protein